MIKINLLPKSIYERRVVKNTAILFGALVVAIIALGILYTQAYWVPRVEQMEADAATAEQIQTEVQGADGKGGIEGETKAWNDKTAPIQTKLAFINNVLDYNLKYPKLYEDIAKWTYEKIAYTSLACNGTEVSMSARARSLDDLGRYLLNMYHATDLFTEVTISGVPGYPMGSGAGTSIQQAAMPFTGTGPQANLAGMSAVTVGVTSGPVANHIGFTVNCKLRTPILAPAFAGTTAPGAAGTPGAPDMGTMTAPQPSSGAAGAPGTPGTPGGPPP